jgi:hypothetical protein
MTRVYSLVAAEDLAAANALAAQHGQGPAYWSVPVVHVEDPDTAPAAAYLANGQLPQEDAAALAAALAGGIADRGAWLEASSDDPAAAEPAVAAWLASLGLRVPARSGFPL